MKILIIGAAGTIGQAVTSALENDHQIITAGRKSGDVIMDITSNDSIYTALESVGTLDAIICAAGDVGFNHFEDLTAADWEKGIRSRLMGQINLTQIGMKYLSSHGSITLTAGIIADHSIAQGTSAATLNGAIEHFVKSVANELPNRQRINVVSPSVVTESLGAYGDFFPGFFSVDASDVAKYYVRAVLGVETGKTLKAFGGN
ncbi:short chain dehydrogenase [Vibrio sp. S4M6]|uniref:short chain dehydrogenase n=1 Tax=Vibrio sinus TaxID=2946865 RepID=UPI00202A118B|nr:short chain dehydrogenase [Vibrio sinus]MCL9780038.1 short chain dehydrogenase [Vibrio sinus]